MLFMTLCVSFLAPAPKQAVLPAADFLRQAEAQRGRVTEWLTSPEAWTPAHAAELYGQLRVAAIVRPRALLPMLVERVAHDPLPGVMGQSKIEPLEKVYPVVELLIAYDRVAVPEIVIALGEIDPTATDHKTERKRTLLIYTLQSILDGHRKGSYWTRAYIRQYADRAEQSRKGNLEGHLKHPMLGN